MSNRTVVISVIGVSGKESIKGSVGVGKSALCNRFVRGDYDDFIEEHSSVLSQTDFSGSPVINNDHWLYWGDRSIDIDDLGRPICVRVIEQTEFLDDETFEPLAGPSTTEPYPKRATSVKLESKDKLMYLQKEQLGLEAEFPQQILPDGKCQVDAFIYVFDAAKIPGRSFESQLVSSGAIISQLVKTKKPFIIAVTKCDLAEENSTKAIQQLTAMKQLKGVNYSIIETSALMDVNVEELFSTIMSAVVKGKSRVKVMSYQEAAKGVSERNTEIRQSYIRLLQTVLPIESWPMQRLSFSSLLIKLGIDRHKDFIAFVRRNGAAAAKKLYDQHVNEAREHWMGARLRALLPKLPHVFSELLDSQDVPRMTWSDAKRVIHSHAFFEEYFLPLGVLGRQLDPLTPDNITEEKRPDPRIPAEILLRGEARDCFEFFKASIEAEQRLEKLEEDFEFLLAETTQVTPGRTLQDASIFLQGYEAYEALAPNQAVMVYDRFQTELVQRAEVEFNECLLENIDIFIELVNSHQEGTLPNRGVYLSEHDMFYLKDILQEEHRYRQLSRLFELRDNMIHQLAAFVANPMISRCQAKNRCVDIVAPEVSLHVLQRRRGIEPIGTVDILVHGDISIVAQFITELNVMLGNEPFPSSSSGPARIRCFGSDEYIPEEGGSSKTQLFLIDSAAALERAKFHVEHCLKDNPAAFRRLPPMYVLVCDPSHYDLLPQLHQQGTMLAERTGGVFIGAGSASSEDSQWSKNSDCSSIFGKDQLVRVCEAACNSSLNSNHTDLRVKVSIMCGDPFPIEVFLNALLSSDGHIFTSAKYNDILGGGTIPLTVLLSPEERCRVDLNLGSYHNWAFSKQLHPRNGHILLFSVKRPASLAHAKAAVTRILDNGSYSVSGKSIFLIAIVDERYNDKCSNLLLSEGAELATSIGASFAALPVDSDSSSTTLPAFLEYFNRLMYIAPQYPTTTTTTSSGDQLKTDNDGYSTLTDFHNLHIQPNFMTSENSSGNSTASTGHLYARKTDGQMKTSLSAGSMGVEKSISPTTRPRRRVAPAVTSTSALLPILPTIMAPLATPEPIDVEATYSLVQDALTDDNHIYATLDFETTNEETEKKEKKRPFRRMFAASAPSSSQQPVATRITSPLTPVPENHRTPALIRATEPLNNYESRSATSGFKNGVKHRRPLLVQPVRLSLSAESLHLLTEGKKKRSTSYAQTTQKFVRKVATSFRIKKTAVKMIEDEEFDNKLLAVEPLLESKSLPQSPQVEKRQMKKLGSNGEKTSSFSWLPSRSPKRNTKPLANENNQRVISPTDTLDSLCKTPRGLPIFLTKCVEFIEKEGGLELEGLYRVPGNQAQVTELEKAFREKGEELSIESMELPVHVVATAVKNFFFRLHEPVIPIHLHQQVIDVLDDPEIAEKLRIIFADLDKSNADVLRYFIGHLLKVSSSPSTAMDIKNLSKVFFPTLFRLDFADYAAMLSGTVQYQRAMEAVILHSVNIFSSSV